VYSALYSVVYSIQGNQIVLTFAQWELVYTTYFGQFFGNYRSSPNFCATLYLVYVDYALGCIFCDFLNLLRLDKEAQPG
jgi:hypothetical protein